MILRKIPGSKKMRPIVNRYKLTFAITGAIIVCLILTSFSVLLYTVTGTAKLDLSRPGYEEVRRKVNNVPSNENSFSPNGTLDETIINEYIKKYKKQSGAINKYDTFNPHLLDDVPLGLSATQVAPSDGAVAIKVVSQVMSRPSDQLVPLLDNFPGTSRRFEKLADNLYSNYAHHPDEIAATLQHASELSEHIVAVYQPHQNIRQHHIDYTGSFDKAEKVYWLPTYLSREDPNLPILTPQQLTQKLDQNKIIFADLNNQLADSIRKEQAAGKLVLIMGAGSIDAWARENLL